MNFNHKNVLVTGGTKGIGKAIVEQFVLKGATVVFCGLEAELGEELVGQLPENKSYFIKTNLADELQINQLLEFTWEKLGHVDILVNNAGAKVQVGDITDHSSIDFDQVVKTNLKSQFLLCKAIIPVMRKKKSGAIINISSTMGIRGTTGFLGYSMSKGAIITMTQSLALDHAAWGIRINCVAPGLVATPATQKWIDEQTDLKAVKGIAMDRAGTPNEIADVVLFLASEKSSYITGAVIPVDGGLSVGEP